MLCSVTQDPWTETEIEAQKPQKSTLRRPCSIPLVAALQLLRLHWNGKACLGDVIYRYISSDQFSSECLLDCLDLSSEHVTVEIANRVEASIYVWRRRVHYKPTTNSNWSGVKSSWEMVKELLVDVDKRELLAERAECLLLSLRNRFPSLTQTSLDTSKIQCNKIQEALCSKCHFVDGWINVKRPTPFLQ